MVIKIVGFLTFFSLLFSVKGYSQDCNEDEILKKARMLRDEGNPKSAEEILLGAVGVCGEKNRILEELGEAVADQGRDRDASRYFEKVVNNQPENLSARLRLAELYLYLGENDGALSHLLYVLKNKPNDPSLHYQIAFILLSMDRSLEAIPYLETYLKAVPLDLDAKLQLYYAYLWNDKPEKALETLSSIVSADPENVDLIKELADRMVDNGKEREAISLYEEVIRKKPNNMGVRLTLAELYQWNDMPKKALQQYEAYLEVNPLDTDVREKALRLSLELGVQKKARFHATFLDPSRTEWGDLISETMLLSQEFGTSIGTGYHFLQYREGISHHSGGLRFSVQATDYLKAGAGYRFHYLSGEYQEARKAVMGHEGSISFDLSLPNRWSLGAQFRSTFYDNKWLSFGGELSIEKQLTYMTLVFMGRRYDYLTTMGDVEKKVTLNTAQVETFVSILDPLFVILEASFGIFSDNNKRVFTEVGIGYVAFRNPRFELSYKYSFEHYSRSGEGITYFSPSHYQIHGLHLSFRHPLSIWFYYGLNLGLLHAVEDRDILINYGGTMGLKLWQRHNLEISYIRTDALLQRKTGRYFENIGVCNYTFEF